MNRLCIFFVFVLFLIPAMHSFLQPFRTPYLGTGYDLRVANPEGDSLFLNGGDPGLRPTRFIIMDDSVCPFCASSEAVANTWFRKDYLADDLIKYYRQIQDRWINLDDEFFEDNNPCEEENGTCWYQQKPILKIGGTCQSLKEAKELLTVKKDVMVTEEVSNIYKEARLLKNKHFNLSSEFKETVCNLPLNFTDETRKEFRGFFKTWGTHVIMELSLGHREIQRKIFSEEDYFKVFLFQNTSLNVNSSNYNVKLIPEILKAFAKMEPYATHNLVHGSKEALVPIRMHLEPISNFVSTCDETVLKETMEEAMKDYLESGYNEEDPQLFVVRDYSRFFVWPRGTFSLPQTSLGCPSGYWSYGSRYHSIEEDSQASSYHGEWNNLINPSDNYKTFTFHFCTKTQKDALSTSEWGKGSYCIFQYGTYCPSGFFYRNIYIYDNYRTFGNSNKVTGTLPSGEYGRNTRYDLCCRDDGTDSPLLLPNKSPLVLVPVLGKACQPVFGMSSKMLWANIDGENKEKSFCSDSSPSPVCEQGYSNRLKIFVCYYERV